MIRSMIGVALVTLLFAGPAALDASAQSASGQPGGATAPAQSAAPVKSPTAARHRAAAEEGPQPTGLEYPPCSRTLRDQCIQLWQTNLSKVYPQCSRLRGSASRAACIEDAYKQQKS